MAASTNDNDFIRMCEENLTDITQRYLLNDSNPAHMPRFHRSGTFRGTLAAEIRAASSILDAGGEERSRDLVPKFQDRHDRPNGFKVDDLDQDALDDRNRASNISLGDLSSSLLQQSLGASGAFQGAVLGSTTGSRATHPVKNGETASRGRIRKSTRDKMRRSRDDRSLDLQNSEG